MAQVSEPLSRPARTSALATCLLLAALASGVGAQQEQGQAETSMASRMILELQQMREEVRELRGLVEAQSQEIENLKRRQRDQYLDLDRRLGELRAGASQASSPQADPDTAAGDESISQAPSGQQGSGAAQGGPDPSGDSNDRAVAGQPQGGRIAPPEVRDPLEEQPDVTTLADPGSGDTRTLREPTEAEQQAYDQAFRALRETRYADAAEGFDAFLRDHPDSAYAPNALYWLGEVYYVTRDFEIALAQFERLQNTYPDSSKQPDALLKVGFSHYELGNWERARAALEQVIADYPGTNYSRLAENRLRTMRLEGNL